MHRVLIWGDMRHVPRQRCPIKPHTLIQGQSAFDVRFCTEALIVIFGLMALKLLLLVNGQTEADPAAIFGTIIIPLALTWLNSKLAEPTSFLITTQGIETERGRMDFSDLERISIFLGTLTLRGRSGTTLTLQHMRAPHLLREVIRAAQQS